VKAVHVHIPYPRIGDYFAHIRKNRLNIEIFFPASSLDDLQPGDLEELRLKLDYNPSLSIHAPFMDMSPGAVDSKVRKVTLERFFQVMDIAEVLSPAAVVFHSGYEKWKYGHRVDIWMEGSIKTWRPLIKRASDLNVRIAIENIFEDEPSNLELLMKELHSDNFGICFDTGHCNLFTKVPLDDWLAALRPYIYELHLHDNDGTFDQHLPIGDGVFDFKKLFAALEDTDRCVYTIEAHSPEGVMKSMERLKEYITEVPSDS
jgi:sugar phosphate isomerase/epimerase